MRTTEIPPDQLRNIMRTNDALKREGKMRSKLEIVRRKLEQMVSELEQAEKITYTGWQILLQRDGSGWKCVGIVNPDTTPENEIPEEWDMALPIPEPNSLPEFEGF